MNIISEEVEVRTSSQSVWGGATATACACDDKARGIVLHRPPLKKGEWPNHTSVIGTIDKS